MLCCIVCLLLPIVLSIFTDKTNTKLRQYNKGHSFPETKEYFDVVLLIPVVDSSFDTRCGIRDSWANLITDPLKYGCKICSTLKLKYLFVADEETRDYAINKENDIFHDIIFLPVKSANYQHLFPKIQHMINYAVVKYNFKLVFKIDPDVYLHVDRFVKLIQHSFDQHPGRDFFFGFFIKGVDTDLGRYNIWYDIDYYNKYGEDKYFLWSIGAAYGVSYNVAKYMANPPGPFVKVAVEDKMFGAIQANFDLVLVHLPESNWGPTSDDHEITPVVKRDLPNLPEDDIDCHKTKECRFIVEHHTNSHQHRAKFHAFIWDILQRIEESPLNVNLNKNICFDKSTDGRDDEILVHNIYSLADKIMNDLPKASSLFKIFKDELVNSKCSLPINNYKWKHVTKTSSVVMNYIHTDNTGECSYCVYDGPVDKSNKWQSGISLSSTSKSFVKVSSFSTSQKRGEKQASDVYCIYKDNPM